MIVPVSKVNERKWAQLCVDLWPDNSVEAMLYERANGMLPNEFLYYAEDEAVAFVSLSLRHDYVEGTETSPVGYLEGIYVKPDFRRRGIAGELVLFAQQWSTSRGCSEFASDCELDNEESRLFHGRLGFKEANRIICFTMELP
ncbi:MAG: GNAT family N-acetyltransferase [Defluviitaleaceae bacterium]|nr:GNAT family N-acetyltransferase [Defluviitaleaceae bacterium]